ncbi:hypothetical protein [Hafnia alvei]|nr:hypothetical protein [Hafnia alvei]
MNVKVIAAFSSDFREQYKADIFKVLSLPKGDVIHFRYKKKYVEQCISQQRQSIEGSDVFIFYTHGNKNLEQSDSKKLTHTSVRKAKILAFDWSETTELYHVRMELDDFIDAEICDEQESPLFFKYVTCSVREPSASWVSRIEVMKNYYDDMIFFYVEGIFDSQGNRIKAKYNHQSKGCFYDVYHGDRYTLSIKLANPKESKKKLFLTCSPDDVVISHCNPIESSVNYDDIYVPLNIKTVPFFKHSNFLSYKVIDSDSGKVNNENLKKNNDDFDLYTVSQELILRLNLKMAGGFGFLCALVFIATMYAGDKSTTIVWPYFKMGLSAILIFFATAGLFYFFNKK